ncbi:MAG: CDP-glucose 4,6-dehydratase [Butyrivibrio sp.]|nr:CDP-glucose 4,6-dehydratase [Butyrivibrio sp.]
MTKANLSELMTFYKGKKVFVTGHTGFKGSWLCKILSMAGAEVMGYSLEPSTRPALFDLAEIDKEVLTIIGDIRDYSKLSEAVELFQPEIVLHLAAQPLVRESYKDPRTTYETNVMGTVNILEVVRRCGSVKSFLNVTTDKVYKNKEWCWGYREDEELDGYDPYSNSKSCSELVTHSYINSFLKNSKIAISTARAGNVLGGGDFSTDRIIPDCIRAVEAGKAIGVRNPNSTRPYQHVLEPLFAYLLIAMHQYEDANCAGFYNVGPDDCDCVTTGQLVNTFCKYWGNGVSWENQAEENAPHEANFLRLDCSKIKAEFGWNPRWHINEVIEKVCEWTKVYLAKGDVSEEMAREIEEYIGGNSK